MILWIDAQLSPHLAPRLSPHFDVEAFSAKWLELRDAKDREIFALKRLFHEALKKALELIEQGEAVVEISDAQD